jgi:hypothetical protein
MIRVEILREIQKLPLNDVRELAEHLTNHLREQETAALATKEDESREDEFERYLRAKGLISQIPRAMKGTRNSTHLSPLRLTANLSLRPSFANADNAGPAR